MKKLLMMVAMMVASATAFAGDSDALKAILKAKTYAEAEGLLNSSLSQLANDAEKAKAYNKLVDLAYDIYIQQDKIRTTNAVMQKNDPVDIEAMILGGKQALLAAMECDKYDILPDAKGKVAPKFHQKNLDRTKSIRLSLLQETEKLVNEKKHKEAYDIFDLYISSSKSPFFEGVQGVATGDPNLGYAAYYGGSSALALENYDKAKEFYKLGIRDTSKQISNYSLDGLIYTMRQARKTAADSVKFINELNELHTQYPQNEKLFIHLSEAYYISGKADDLLKLADEYSAINPSSAYPDYFRGYVYLEIENYKDLKKAIEYFSKVPEGSPVYLNSIFNIGTCHQNLAAEFSDDVSKTGQISAANKKILIDKLNETKKFYEKCKELDPDENTVKWSYRLENIDYNIDQLK